MLAKIGTIGATAISAFNQARLEHQKVAETPKVESGSAFYDSASGIGDFTVGLTMGLYGPMATVAYEDSCFTQWFNLANASISYSKLWDSEERGLHGLHLGIFIYEQIHNAWIIYEISHVCSAQYELGQTSGWWDAYAHNRALVEGGDGGWESTVHLVLEIIGLAVHGYEAYESFESGYYHFFAGQYSGLTVGLTLAIMQHFGVEIFKTETLWERYPGSSH